MGRPVYSVDLWSMWPTVAGGQSNVVGEVTDTVVIRDIVFCYRSSGLPVALNDAALEDEDGVTIFQVPQGEAIGGRVFHWEGRQVVPGGSALTFYSLDAGWSIRVMGYVLTPT